MKNILISTGGSGGHVVPATILYEHLKNDNNIFITSDDRGIKFLDKKKYNMKVINVIKLSKNFLLIPFQIILLLSSIAKSFIFLKRKKIEILISTGGYMSLPLCLAANFLKMKIFLFEPNMVLGRSNKFFINSCEKIFCYSNSIKNYPNNFKNKISLIPTLLRKNFYSTKPAEAIDKKINLLIIGGSQGTELFDNIITKSVIELSKRYKLEIFQQTGFKNYDFLKNFYLKNNIDNKLFNFDEDISTFMSNSNICITRAGASTLAELTYLNLPHLAIPLPSAKDNHQFENARLYEEAGCNWIMNQDEINEDKLTDKLINIIKNKEDYLTKKRNMKNFSYQNNWNDINQKIIKIINEN